MGDDGNDDAQADNVNQNCDKDEYKRGWFFLGHEEEFAGEVKQFIA